MAPPRGYSRHSRAEYVDPYADQRADDIADRHARARAALEANGGHTPMSERSRPLGLSDPADWRKDFPTAPTGYSNGVRPTISARDEALAAGPKVQQVQFAPPPAVTKDKNGLPVVRPASEYIDYYRGHMGKTNVGAPQIDPRALAAIDQPEVFAPKATEVLHPAGGGTPAPIVTDPSLPPAVVSDTGIQRMSPEEQGRARASLQALHPAIFTADTPENKAFVAHAKQFGEQSAHDNAEKIVAGAQVDAAKDALKTAAPISDPATSINPYA